MLHYAMIGAHNEYFAPATPIPRTSVQPPAIAGWHPAEGIIDMKLPRPVVFFGPRKPHEGVYYSAATNALRIGLALVTLALALWAIS